jgi:hypothetical protein
MPQMRVVTQEDEILKPRTAAASPCITIRYQRTENERPPVPAFAPGGFLSLVPLCKQIHTDGTELQ